MSANFFLTWGGGGAKLNKKRKSDWQRNDYRENSLKEMSEKSKAASDDQMKRKKNSKVRSVDYGNEKWKFIN